MTGFSRKFVAIGLSLAIPLILSGCSQEKGSGDFFELPGPAKKAGGNDDPGANGNESVTYGTLVQPDCSNYEVTLLGVRPEQRVQIYAEIQGTRQVLISQPPTRSQYDGAWIIHVPAAQLPPNATSLPVLARFGNLEETVTLAVPPQCHAGVTTAAAGSTGATPPVGAAATPGAPAPGNTAPGAPPPGQPVAGPPAPGQPAPVAPANPPAPNPPAPPAVSAPVAPPPPTLPVVTRPPTQAPPPVTQTQAPVTRQPTQAKPTQGGNQGNGNNRGNGGKPGKSGQPSKAVRSD